MTEQEVKWKVVVTLSRGERTHTDVTCIECSKKMLKIKGENWGVFYPYKNVEKVYYKEVESTEETVE